MMKASRRRFVSLRLECTKTYQCLNKLIVYMKVQFFPSWTIAGCSNILVGTLTVSPEFSTFLESDEVLKPVSLSFIMAGLGAITSLRLTSSVAQWVMTVSSTLGPGTVPAHPCRLR